MDPGRQRLAPFVPPVACRGDCKASFDARAVERGGVVLICKRG